MKYCPKSLSVHDLKDWINSEDEQPIIIDVRETMELEIADFPYTDVHIPMSKVSIDYVFSKLSKYKGKKIVVLCHMGIRSYNFGTFLLDNKFVQEVWNLEDGIDGWSKYIDSNVPRY